MTRRMFLALSGGAMAAMVGVDKIIASGRGTDAIPGRLTAAESWLLPFKVDAYCDGVRISPVCAAANRSEGWVDCFAVTTRPAVADDGVSLYDSGAESWVTHPGLPDPPLLRRIYGRVEIRRQGDTPAPGAGDRGPLISFLSRHQMIADEPGFVPPNRYNADC